MPALVRRLLIWAAADGLILQAHGPTEHHKSIIIDYKSRQIKDAPANSTNNKITGRLESHGVIGLISIASFTFLVAITQRNQVAQIFGKPVYVITDVTIIPLSSQAAAEKAIAHALASRSAETTPESDSDFSDTDEDEPARHQSPEDEPASPEEQRSPTERDSTSTNIARDVMAKRGQYSRFASQWFTRQGWEGGKAAPPVIESDSKEQTDEERQVAAGSDVASDHDRSTKQTSLAAAAVQEEEDLPTSGSITNAIPKILRTTKLILTSRSFFFSYEFDLTTRLALLNGDPKLPSRETLDPLYFWNRRLGEPFFDGRQDAFFMPILQGFVGQRTFTVQKSHPRTSRSASVVAAHANEESAGLEKAISQAKEAVAEAGGDTETYLLTLVSRRSVKRSGLRYLRRGIDDEGNCANAVETEQILSAPDWSLTRRIRSFVQIRSSIPLYFSQSPYSFKPVPVMYQSESTNEAAMKRHFQDLKQRYGGVQISVLVDKHGGEVLIGNAYEKAATSLIESHKLEHVQFDWFDFHHECRGMKFENVSRLVEKFDGTLRQYGETVLSSEGLEKQQTGIIRTNCMDCLDRTNVSQSAFGQYMLQKDLQADGFEIDLLHDESTTWFNTLWADNGDAISRLYAGTAALKGDFTRTRKRNYRGALNDFSLTLNRYYNNMVNDYFSQAVIDVLLGNISWKAFEDFESTVKSADPGISISKVRQTAIEHCSKQVIQGDNEDLIHGWTMLTPAQENTLRTLPFQEAVVLLTDAAVYCCKFDWTTEKIASFEKVDLRSILKIRYGTYITSTLSERQMKEDSNVGVVIVYQPGKGDMIRTNTRSLQNIVEPKSDAETRIDGGTGILSWIAPLASPSSRTVALKVIPMDSDSEGTQGMQGIESPLDTAEHIAGEVRRAITGASASNEGGGKDLVEKEAIISLAEAKKRTGYLEQLGHSIKKLVWT